MAKVKDEFRYKDLLLSVSIDDDGLWKVILDNDDSEILSSMTLGDEAEAIAVFNAVSDLIPRIYGGQL